MTLTFLTAFSGILATRQDQYEDRSTFQAAIPTRGQEVFAFFTYPITNVFTERMNLSIREDTRITFGIRYW